MIRQIPQRLAQLATALGLFLLASSLVEHHPDAGTAAEARYLLLLVLASLLALALSPRTVSESVVGGSAVALALFLPEAQGTRAAAVVAILVAMVAWRSWQTFNTATPRWLDVTAVLVAWQVILRSDRLLGLRFEAATLIWLVVLPVTAAAATTFLARSCGGRRAGFTIASLVLLIPGVGVATTAIVTVLAAASGYRRHPRLAGTLIVLASTLAIWRTPAGALPLLALVAALVLLPVRHWRWSPVAVAGLWAATLWTGGPWSGNHDFGWLLLLLPAVWLSRQTHWSLVATASALLLAAASGEPAAAAPALALLSAAVAEQQELERWQAVWSLGLLSASALAAGYPWLRGPLGDLLPATVSIPMLAMTGLTIACWLLWQTLDRHFGRRARNAGLLLVVIPSALYLPQPSEQLLAGQAATLTLHQRAWISPIEMTATNQLTVDSFLTRSHGVEDERTVATVRLIAANGEHRDFVLRAGVETADWAGHQNLRAWIHWLAPDGSLAQRYRASWQVQPPFAAQRIEIRRPRRLPQELQVNLLQVTVR